MEGNRIEGVTRREALAGVLAAGASLGAGRLFGEGGAAGGDGVPRVKSTAWRGDEKCRLPLMGIGTAHRFPHLKGKGQESIDEKLGTELIDYSMAHGVNWFDTGYIYHHGESERFIGRALVGRHPRESFMVTDKMPTWMVHKKEDLDRLFGEQLKRCKLDYFDFYFMHSIRSVAEYEKTCLKMGSFDFIRKQKEAGKVKRIGISFHGRSDLLGRVLDENPDIEICMLMLNAMEFKWNKDAPKLAETAAKRGVGVVVMEPLAGGRAAKIGGKAMEMLKQRRPGDTAARWGMRFAASEPGVVTVFSGVSRMDHLKENIETFGEGRYEPMGEEERRIYTTAMDVYMGHKTIPCTGCRYCMPCEYGVKIADLFQWYNHWAQEGAVAKLEGKDAPQELKRKFLASYATNFKGEERAERCLGCKKCLKSCPQWTFKAPVELEKIANLVAKVRGEYLKAGGRLQ